MSQNPHPASDPSPASPNAPGAAGAGDTTVVSREHWKWSTLAGMASYLDAGSIVALSAGLVMFEERFGLSKGSIGVLTAIGPNALGCALGALIGGWLGDKLGRKRIYQYDLMVYAVGILLIALATHRWMLFGGTFIVGLAVGADVPTSLALVGEFAPSKARGKLLGYTQVAWCMGPVIVLWLAMGLAPWGLFGIRIVFLHLFVVAIVTWALRQGLAESARWKEAKKGPKESRHQIGALLTGSNLKALVWTATIYLFWNLTAGTYGIFFPYFIKTLHAGDQAVSVGLSSANFLLTMIFTVSVFMRYSDRSYAARKTIWGVGAVMEVAAFVLFLIFPFSIPVILCNILLWGSSAALSGEAFYKVFSQELFPTMLRGTAQGITFGVARTILGIWSFYVPVLAGAGIRPVAALLALFLIISGVVGYFFMPDTSGKSLEQIEAERA